MLMGCQPLRPEGFNSDAPVPRRDELAAPLGDLYAVQEGLSITLELEPTFLTLSIIRLLIEHAVPLTALIFV